MWLFDLSGFDPNSGFSFRMDSQKNETSLKWIVWIRISEVALNKHGFFLVSDSKPNHNKTKPSETKTGFRLCKFGFRFCD